jgi:hypothetical protein
MMKNAAIFLIVVIDTAILSSVVSTQLVLADVQSFGLVVSFGDRLKTTLHDLLGLGPPLLILIGLCFLIAFFVARRAIKIIGGSPTIWYMVAGLTSVPAGIIVIRYFLGVTLPASARTPLGMFLIACCCMAGGWLYGYLMARYGRKETADA